MTDYMTKAADIMAKVDGMEVTIPIARALTEQALVYATLATAQATACGMCPLGGQLAANHLSQVSAEHAPVHTLKPRGERPWHANKWAVSSSAVQHMEAHSNDSTAAVKASAKHQHPEL